MRKSFVYVCACSVVALIAMTESASSQTATSKVFETTFNCPADWNQAMGLNENQVCGVGDAISGYGAWTTAAGSQDQIIVAANNPTGGGGRGLRHWRGDGQNNNGGGVKVQLPVPLTEMWVRWTMRYQQGFTWTNGGPGYSKELFFDIVPAAPQNAVGWKYADTFGTTTFHPSRNIDGAPGWLSTMKGATGDGLWHTYEVHFKTDTNRTNGIFEAWIDGQRTVSANDVDWGGATFNSFVIGSNQYDPANGRDMYTDYDDVVVSTTSLGSIKIPSAPTNVHIMK